MYGTTLGKSLSFLILYPKNLNQFFIILFPKVLIYSGILAG